MKTKMRSRLRCMALEERVTPAIAGGTDPEIMNISRTEFNEAVTAVIGNNFSTFSTIRKQSDGHYIIAANTTTGFVFGRVLTNGTLDTTFGTQGLTFISTNLQNTPPDQLRTLQSFENGTILLGADYFQDDIQRHQIITISLNANGIPTSTYGTNGVSILPLTAADADFTLDEVLLDHNQRVVLKGSSSFFPTSPNYRTILARLDSTGMLDPQFGTNGWTYTEIPNESDYVIGEQPTTGRIIITASLPNQFYNFDIAVIGFNDSGHIDPTFGTNGFVSVAIDLPTGNKADAPSNLFFRPDGSMTIAGTAVRSSTSVPRFTTLYEETPVLIRMNANGSLDEQFGEGGVALLNSIRVNSLYNLIGMGYERIFAVKEGSAHSLLFITDFGGFPIGPDTAVTRVQSFGEIDLSYGQKGTAFIDASSNPFFENLELPVIPLETIDSDLQVSGSNSGSGTVIRTTNSVFSTLETVPYFGGSITVRTFTADVNGDGVPDLIGGSGPGGGPHVIVIDGKTKFRMAEFFAFEQSFWGGINVTAGDLNGDGKAEIIVTPDRGGGPIVAVYDGAKLADGFNNDAQLTRFFGIDDKNFRGGARVAVGDVNGDGTADLLVSAGFEGGPRIALFDGKGIAPGTTSPPKLIPDFFAFEPSLRNGAYVTLGDLNGDGQAELVFGGGPGGSPRVRLFDGKGVLNAGSFKSLDEIPGAQLANFFAADADRRGGIRLAIKEIDGSPALLAGSGENEAAQLRVFPAATLLGSANPQPSQVLDLFNGAVLADGVFVG